MRRDWPQPRVKDPVCKMVLAKKTAVADYDYEGRAYYFCAEICRDEFAVHPERYIRSRKRRPAGPSGR